MTKLRAMFMGTPDFADVIFKALAERHTVTAVVTQTDKPVGRRQVMTLPPVKITAQEMGIPVYQFQTLKNGELREALDLHRPEVIVVAAYGKLLPEYVLNYPKYGCINIHGSLLPKYRGAGPVQWAVINGEKVTGLTSMYMGKGMDTGDMLLKCETEIGEYETYGELMDRLAPLGARLMLDTLDALADGTVSPIKQNEAEATNAPMLDKKTALLDFKKTDEEVVHLIHGLNPWPVAYTYRNGKKLKIFRAEYGKLSDKEAGFACMNEDRDGIEITCGNGKTVVARVVQAEGAKKMEAKLYLMGNPINKETYFKSED